MPTQAIKPDIPDAFNNQMYTTPSPNKEAMKAILPTIDVTINALTGTPRLSNLPRNFGAFPWRAKSQSIRVDAYIPELPADSTAVKITAFITEAAKATPAFSKISVNGLTVTSLAARLSVV
ncbi:Uncharacterised protein [Streptococcus pneumoniae]|nr:Uncharacterised protein [Streptococcus pneumoniae]CJJ00193.1 Uncharacterised protein [Streptococcus pneumoniae]